MGIWFLSLFFLDVEPVAVLLEYPILQILSQEWELQEWVNSMKVGGLVYGATVACQHKL